MGKAPAKSEQNGLTNGHEKPEQHFKDWPNAAGFDTRGDVRKKIDLPITGRFPDYVAGSLYRTGPGQSKVPLANKDGQFEVSHWFDGFTVVHKFDLTAGDNGRCQQVTYQSYSQVDEALETARQTGRLEGVSFGQKRDPCDSFYKKLKTTFAPSSHAKGGAHGANIGVVFRETLPSEVPKTESGRRLMTVTTDATSAKSFDADTLEPLGVTQQQHIHKSLTGPLSGAHASTDPMTGDYFNYNLAFERSGPVYRIFRASPTTGEVEILATISGYDIKGAYIHSISLTENFVIVTIWPAYFKWSGASLIWERNILDSIAPFPKEGEVNARATWLVVDRRQGRGLVGKYQSPPFFCFHTTNAWEEPSKQDPSSVDLTIELIEFPNLDILHQFYYHNLVSNSPGALKGRALPPHGLARYNLAQVPLSSTPKLPDFPSQMPHAHRTMYIPAPASGDLPRFNPNYSLKPHRYVWGVTGQGKSSFFDCLVKTDTSTQTCVRWEREKHTPGEPIFVPDPDGEDEDDGVVLSVVLDGETSQSYLVCLNAKDMKEMGRVDVGRPVGFGFHGTHVAQPARS